MKRIRLDSLKEVKTFYKRLITQYYNDDNLSGEKFQKLIYGLNGYIKAFEVSELEKKVDLVISELEERNKNFNLNADEYSGIDIDSIINN